MKNIKITIENSKEFYVNVRFNIDEKEWKLQGLYDGYMRHPSDKKRSIGYLNLPYKGVVSRWTTNLDLVVDLRTGRTIWDNLMEKDFMEVVDKKIVDV